VWEHTREWIHEYIIPQRRGLLFSPSSILDYDDGGWRSESRNGERGVLAGEVDGDDGDDDGGIIQ